MHGFRPTLNIMIKRSILPALAAFAIFAAAGCASDNATDTKASRAPSVAEQHRKKGYALLDQHHFAAAMAEFNLALQADPTDTEALLDRGTCAMYLGRWPDAIADFDAAIKLKPDYAAAWGCRGLAHGRTGMYADALADFQQMVKLTPQDDWAWSYLAELLATCKDDGIRNGPAAIQAATRACELSQWKVGFHIYILAAAYAETGDFDKAVSFEQKALQVGAATPEEHNRMVLNLSLYKFHFPFHDPTIFQ
jgi:tetratricopeptide (TPR) repeat protein